MGALAGGTTLVQVTEKHLRLLDHGTSAIETRAAHELCGREEEGLRLAQASFAGAFALVLASNGAVVVLEVKADGQGASHRLLPGLQASAGCLTAGEGFGGEPGSYFALLVLRSGRLVLLDCLSGVQKASWDAFSLCGPYLLSERSGSEPLVADQPSSGPMAPSPVAQILVGAFQSAHKRHQVLFASLGDGSVLAYQWFRSTGGRWGLRKVLSHLRGPGQDETPALVRFRDLKGSDPLGQPCLYEGVFIPGERPAWMLFHRGRLSLHPMESEGRVASFSSFNTPDSLGGFLLSTGKALRPCQLPSRLALRGLPAYGGICYQKVALDPSPLTAYPTTPVKCCYHPELRILAVATSRRDIARVLPPLEDVSRSEPTQALSYLTAQALLERRGREEVHEILFKRAGSWATVFKLQLEPFETVQALECLPLMNTTTKATQQMVVVGTLRCLGEDYPVLGRLLLIELGTSEETGEVQASVSCQLEKWRGFHAFGELEGNLVASCADMNIGGCTIKILTWNGAEVRPLPCPVSCR